MNEKYLIGLDVGTGSVRAGVFDKNGAMLSATAQPIKIWHPQQDYVEQSSEEIWQACCNTIKEAVKNAEINPFDIQGIGFDATCSLVVLDQDDQPISVTPGEDDHQNIMVWMDHRAKNEANLINQTKHEVLKYVGGVISPEMQTPKLLWLKKNHPETWKKANKFFDLPDYLVYKATGEDVRSICTTTCKWTYLAHENPISDDSIGRWETSFFESIGLNDLLENGSSKIGQTIRPMGEPVGNGLTGEAARNMGLKAGTPVGVSIIDAHAGGLGLLGMTNGEEEETGLENGIALIGGTSSCHMAVSQQPIYIDGVWGPYYSAMIPGLWLNEGGQSATGALIDHVIFSSHHAGDLQEKAEKNNTTVYNLLNERLSKLTEDKHLSDVGLLTKDLHILPYFHGNRSPRANPSLTGSICGLKLSSTIDDLALQYLSAIQGIAYGTKHIIETLNEKGYTIKRIFATGGGTKNKIFLQQHSDICGCDIILPKEQEAVLLGSAVLGAVAACIYSTVAESMQQMNQAGKIIKPNHSRDIVLYHHSKYQVFHKMYQDEISYAEMMEGASEMAG
ncbi:MAG: FGGY-family carbohydrate kinase [Balneolaceae bacterium]